jgi:hypothetical protein
MPFQHFPLRQSCSRRVLEGGDDRSANRFDPWEKWLTEMVVILFLRLFRTFGVGEASKGSRDLVDAMSYWPMVIDISSGFGCRQNHPYRIKREAPNWAD